MTDLHRVIWGEGEPVICVHGSMGWGTDTFAKQRPLSDRFRLVLIDRRGYGLSPPTARSDFEADARDVAEALESGTHLVGHSYGGVVCLLAAGARPKAVRSLTVIELPAFGLARGDASVEEAIRGLSIAYAQSDPVEFYFAFVGAPPGEPRPDLDLSPGDVAAIRTTMKERPPWEAVIPHATLAQAGFPKLVVSGGRNHLPPLRRAAPRARALKAVCEALAAGMGAELFVVQDAAHNPQLEAPEAFNARLRAFLDAAAK